MNYNREPLHCVDNVCDQNDRCFFCGVAGSTPCRFPKYAAQIKKQVENPLLRHTLIDNGTSVKVTTSDNTGQDR